MKITRLTTELMVDNMKKTVEFYTKKLGFEVSLSMPEDNPFFVIISNNGFEIMLYSREQFSEEIPHFETQPLGGTVALYINVNDIMGVYEELKVDTEIIQDMHNTNYGTKEFSCKDPNGYVLMFAETAL